MQATQPDNVLPIPDLDLSPAAKRREARNRVAAAHKRAEDAKKDSSLKASKAAAKKPSPVTVLKPAEGAKAKEEKKAKDASWLDGLVAEAKEKKAAKKAAAPNKAPPARPDPVLYATQEEAVQAAMKAGRNTTAVSRTKEGKFVLGSKRAAQNAGHTFLGRAESLATGKAPKAKEQPKKEEKKPAEEKKAPAKKAAKATKGVEDLLA